MNDKAGAAGVCRHYVSTARRLYKTWEIFDASYTFDMESLGKQKNSNL